jgi:hypothetical protein
MGIHLLIASSNSNSVPSSWTRRNLLSSLENEILSSESNSSGFVGKEDPPKPCSCLCSMIVVMMLLLDKIAR